MSEKNTGSAYISRSCVFLVHRCTRCYSETEFKSNAIFSRTFAAGNKIKQFYELLVEDSLRREDVDSLSRENMKNLHEMF